MTWPAQRKLLWLLVKLAVSVGLVAWLANQAGQDPESLRRLRDDPKRWSLIVAAAVCCSGAVLFSFFRWYLLVRALDIRFSPGDAVRLGFLGHMFNQVALGSVGGDLFKAVFLAREQPGRRTEAVATVVVDRVAGLYGLALLATTGLWLVGAGEATRSAEMRWVIRGTIAVTVGGCAGLVVLVARSDLRRWLANHLGGLPLVGPTLARVCGALGIYRARPAVLVLGLVLSVVVQFLLAMTLLLVARGLPGTAPGFAEHLLIGPLAMGAAATPLPLGGLGALEGAVEFLYRHAPLSPAPPGRGLVVALGYRLITWGLALVGVGYFLAGRRAVRAALSEAEDVAAAAERR